MKFSERSLKLILFAIFCFYILIGLFCISAIDVDNVTFNKELNNDNIDIPVNASYESIQKGNALGDFDELNDNIQNLSSGDAYNIDKNYSFNGEINSSKQYIIIDKDNITINGNGHTIDGQHLSGLFKITANNIKIYNLTFIGFEFHGLIIKSPTVNVKDPEIGGYYTYTENYSPIEWMGDNGVISDCTFHENSAINGGALPKVSEEQFILEALIIQSLTPFLSTPVPNYHTKQFTLITNVKT